MLKSTILAGAAALSFAAPADAEVRVERVEFTSHGERLVGDLYIPSDVAAARPAPAVVVTGAWMTVKEQMPARYAREMAGRGFVALAFDFRGWGQGGGARRQIEDPSAKIEDIGAALAYLATRPEADADRLAGLGICASSGYMVHAATRFSSMRSVALVAPWLHDRQIVEETYGGLEGVEKLVSAGKTAEGEFRRTGKQSFVPAASLTDERAVMFKAPYYTESDRGMLSAWRNEVDPSFWHGWLTFDAISAAPKIRQPILMVHSEAAAIPQGAHRFYSRVTAPKTELWLEGISQFDFYDRDGPVQQAAGAAAAHFEATLQNTDK